MTTGLTEAQAMDLANTALSAWGGHSPRLIKMRENIVYEVQLPTGRAALRLHRPGYQSASGIEAELIWTRDLAKGGLHVPLPIATLSGALTTTAGNRTASCVSWVLGDPIGAAELPLAGSEPEQAALMERVGRLAAQLHDATDALRLPESFPRPHWDTEGYLGDTPLWGPFWTNPAFSKDDLALIEEARAKARRLLTDLRPTADWGLIHADMLRENILAQGTELTLIDFDDCGWGFRLYDLATAIVQSLEEPTLPTLARALIRGYASLRPVDSDHLALFVMLRTFASAGWIATRAGADDPRQAFYASRATRMARHILDDTAPWGKLG